MAVLNLIPDTKNFSGTVSNAGLSSVSGSVKLVPKNADGTVFDCTGYNSATMRVGQQPITSYSLSQNVTLAIDSAGATGITVHMTPTQLDTLLTAFGQAGNYPCNIEIGNGTDTASANRGSLLINLGE